MIRRVAVLLILVAACDRPGRTPDGGQPPECAASAADIIGEARQRRDVECREAIARATEAHRYKEMKQMLQDQLGEERALRERSEHARRRATDEAAEDEAVAKYRRKKELDSAGRKLAHDEASHGCWVNNSGHDCGILATMDLGHGGFTADAGAAESALVAGCKLGDGTSCIIYALELTTGEHLPKNRARAASIQIRACDLHEQTACANVANDIVDGILEPADMKKAAAFLRKHCDADEGASCSALGAYLSRATALGPAKPTESRALISKACRLQFAPACDELNGPPP